MARGAATIRRHGKRRITWALKFRDATGRQVWETLGHEPEWNEQRAERELGKRLQAVERDRWRKPKHLTFGDFASRFKTDYLPTRNLKPSTQADYRSIIDRRLIPFFGDRELNTIEPADIDAYMADAMKKLTSKTVKNHIALLRVMFKVAIRWRLLTTNPISEIDQPRVEPKEMNVLTEVEIARLLTAYRELEASADDEQEEWWRLTRQLVEVALTTALRRGELLALRWRDIALLEGRLTVREAVVRGKFQTPKSLTSRRTIELGPRALKVLGDVFEESRYRSDESLVFGHPALGTPLDPSKMSRTYMRPALKRAGITKPFRPWHDLRHTALTHEAAAGNPQAYIQLKAGHSQGSITERYIHAAQVLFPGAAEKAESRLFSAVTEESG